MPFDPNKPFDVVPSSSSGFDPNKPFDKIEERLSDFGKELKEQFADIPAMALHNATPFAPVVDKLTDRKGQQEGREDYNSYLNAKYPVTHGAATIGANLAMLPARMLMGGASVVGQGLSGLAQMVEPYVGQAVSHPESVGPNLETTLNVGLPLVGAGAIHAYPYAKRGAAQSLAKLKGVNQESVAKYQANPETYNQTQQFAENNPVANIDAVEGFESTVTPGPMRNVVGEVRNNLITAETRNQTASEKVAEALAAHKEKIAAQKGVVATEELNQKGQRIAGDDLTKQDLTINAHEADMAKEATKKLQKRYQASAMKRNKILEEQDSHFPVDEYVKRLYAASDYDVDPVGAAKLARAAQIIEKRAGEGGAFDLSARKLNEIRAEFQNQSGFQAGPAYTEKANRELRGIAHDMNEALDAEIPVNNELRAALRQETIDFNAGMKLFGREFNLGQLRSAAKDPQKAAVVKRIMAKAEISDLDEALSKPEQLRAYLLSKKMGVQPQVPADSAVAMERQKLADMEYKGDMYKQTQSLIKDRSVPISSKNATNIINQDMLTNEWHPKFNQDKQLNEYASRFDPEFFDKYERAKVLRDLSRADFNNGAKMTHWGAGVGATAGATVGAVVGNPLAGAFIGRELGAVGGGFLDKNASGLIKSGLASKNFPFAKELTPQSGLSIKNFTPQSTLQKLISSGVLQGTKYAGMFTGDSAKDAIAHKLMFNRDPEYAKLVMGEQE